MGSRALRRLSLVNPLEACDGLALVVLGGALMAGKVRGVAPALPGNVVASLLVIAAGGLLITGRILWPESERRVTWSWIGLLALAVPVYGATNFL